MWAVGLALVVVFHHIHVNDASPQYLFTYYERLFRSDTTRRVRFGPVEGVQSGGVFLLVNRVPRMPPEDGAVWHFGWGDLSLGEGYDGHRLREEWDPPLESLAKGLHLHLESEDPVRAAEWYRDHLGARIDTAPDNGAVQPINPVFRRPVALVRLDGIEMAIYRATDPVPSSSGRRVDHIAFKIEDLDAARAIITERGLRVIGSGRLDAMDTLMIEGPDRLAIELVAPPKLRP